MEKVSRIWIFFWNWKNCHYGDQYFPVWDTLSMFVVPISHGISVTYLDIFWNWKNCHNGDQYFPVWNTLSMFVVTISHRISVTYLDMFRIWKNCHNKKKRYSHCKCCARAKAKDRVQRWRRRALPVALVVCCWRRSSNKAPHLASNISLPVHWKWKKKKVGLSSVMSELKISTL